MIKRILTMMFFAILVPQAGFATLATSGQVYMLTESGNWVGGGLGDTEVLWMHGLDGLFDINGNSDQGATISFDKGDNWSFDFTAPTYDPLSNTNDGNLLEVGSYENATRFPFNSPTSPGLDVSGNGRGNNTLSGRFWIFDIVHDEAGAPISLAVDFLQYDGGHQSGPALFGSLRVNSDVPLHFVPVPEPGTHLLAGGGLALLVFWRRRVAQRKPWASWAAGAPYDQRNEGSSTESLRLDSR